MRRFTPLRLEALETRDLPSATSLVGVVRNGNEWRLAGNLESSVVADTRFFGARGDQFLNGDWNDDGFTDLIAVRNSGDGFLTWNIDISGAGIVGEIDVVHRFGLNGDVAFLGDWDGNGTQTPGVARQNPRTGGVDWLLDNDRKLFANPPSRQFGLLGDISVVGDWDGNGTTDLGAVRPDRTEGLLQWFLDTNGDEFGDVVRYYGLLSTNDTPVPGDWDRDGNTDLGVTRNTPDGDRQWLFDLTGEDKFADKTQTFGKASDIPVVGDWFAKPPEDRFEENDRIDHPSDLGTLSGRKTIDNLTMTDGDDFYRFTMGGAGTAEHFVSIRSRRVQGDLDLELFDNKQHILRASREQANSETISLDGLAAGTYVVHVLGFKNSINLGYTLDINPSLRLALADDRFDNVRQNNTPDAASDLRTLPAPRTFDKLIMADNDDFYHFKMLGPGNEQNFVRISSTVTTGDLDLEILDSNFNPLRASNSKSNTEKLSLNGLLAGEYIIHVIGFANTVNRDYTLLINPGKEIKDDGFENNDTPATAKSLDKLRISKPIENLRMVDGHDYYRFELTGVGNRQSFVAINFQNGLGNLDLEVIDVRGRKKVSRTTGNQEFIRLDGFLPGVYVVHVVAVRDATSPDYTLVINATTRPAVLPEPPDDLPKFNPDPPKKDFPDVQPKQDPLPGIPNGSTSSLVRTAQIQNTEVTDTLFSSENVFGK